MTNQPTQTAADRPVDMIIFGGGGDLAARKLLPALYMAHLHCNLPPETRIIAVGRRDWGIDGYRKFMDEQSRPFIDEKAFDPAAWSRFLDLFKYVLIDVNTPDDYLRLAEAARGDAIRVFYLSTSPDSLPATGFMLSPYNPSIETATTDAVWALFSVMPGGTASAPGTLAGSVSAWLESVQSNGDALL